MKSPRFSLAALLGAQAQVMFNSNAAQLMLIALAQFPGVLGAESDPDAIRSLLGVFLVVPFLLFSPLAGWFTDRFSKTVVLNLSLGMQFVSMVLLVTALWLHSLWGAVACFILLPLQATIFAPAKRAVLREMVPAVRLARVVGWMEMLSVTALLLGGFGGGRMFDFFAARAQLGGPGGVNAAWQAALMTAIILTVASAVSWLLFQIVERTPAQSSEPFGASLFVRHGALLTELWQARSLFRAAMGIVFFYSLGGFVYLLLTHIGAEVHQGGVGSGTDAGIMLLLLGFGTMLGNISAGLLSRRGIELGLVPIGGTLLLLALLVLSLVGEPGVAFSAGLVTAGFAGGMLVVPLYAFIQETAGAHSRGRVLAAVGLMDSAGGLLASGLFFVFNNDRLLNWGHSAQILFLAAFTLGMLVWALWHLPHDTVCSVMRLIGPIFYWVQVRGAAHVPVAGGGLIICNHLSYVDAVVLQIASPRNLRFVAFAGRTRSPILRYLYRALGVIPVALNKPTKGIRLAAEAVGRGEVVCVFPEGAISRTGQLMGLKNGFCLIAEAVKVPVVPAVIDGMWGSVFSFAGNKYLWKSPRLMPTHVLVQFGQPIPADQVSRPTARKALLDLTAEAFAERPILRRNLGRECIRALAKRPGCLEIVDRTADRREINAGQLLAAAAAFSRHIKKIVPEQRIGIVLPPGIAGTLVNLAVVCAGKTPVNLNFTTGRAALEASFRRGEIKTIITADAMRARLPNFPWLERTLDLQEEMKAMGGKRAILPWLLAAWLLPNQWVAGLLGLPREGDDEEAALLFTSGSAGEPKGVVLSHRNVLANCAQISSLSILPKTAILVGCLPLFHSMGFTVTIWYPILRGCRVVTVPSPLDTRRIVEAIAQEKATVLVGAPTFIRPFLKKATKEELQSLAIVATGAEKLPLDLYEAFLKQFGIEIMQCYGLTETTPVSNVNQPDPPITVSTARHQIGKRTGSVGRLLPGMTARIVDPETGVELPMNDTGLIWLRGANVFRGYLNDSERTAQALRGDWFVTGDLGRFDDDGFLHIEGRLSRFSKIGGEMVPHGVIEQAVINAYGWEPVDDPMLVIVGVSDATKGESLVLLTTQDVSTADVRDRLMEANLPNLWIPKAVRRVEKIPVLGSCKTDFKGCRTLALEMTREVTTAQ
ncbi:MAG: MFS transporter [Opitutaceae bacterium]|nr:MFS transporter [Opitutaceae bacterium]